MTPAWLHKTLGLLLLAAGGLTMLYTALILFAFWAVGGAGGIASAFSERTIVGLAVLGPAGALLGIMLLDWTPRALTSNTVGIVVLVLVLVGTLSLVGTDGQGTESGPYPFADVASGQLIAYTGPNGIHLIRADGGQSWAVPGTEPMSGPEWAPDGLRLAAVDLQDCCKAYSFALDGSERARLPADSDTTPVWSPDGRRLAAFREEDTRIHLTPLRKGLRETVLPVTGNQPEWSPDGGLIAFQSNTGSDVLRIFVVRPDGSRLRALTANTGDGTGATAASWSPDGQRIAFSSDADGDEDIYVIRLDGTGLRKITHNSADDSSPTWSPDGRRIAFDRSIGDFDVTSIVVLNLVTGIEDEIARERDDGGGNMVFEPSWQPAPKL